jgi:tRNA-2-methylthio-N6-dimethylallyladenosine synthase
MVAVATDTLSAHVRAHALARLDDLGARPQRFVHVETMGCQMNVYDSDRMLEVLGRAGYAPTDIAERADLLIVNTCSIRDKVEHKVVSLLGVWRKLKAFNPDLVVGVAGCVAQQEGDKLFAKAPGLDLVVGPDQIARLPELVDSARERQQRTAATEFVHRKEYAFPQPEPPQDGRVTAMVTVMKGCNKVCSFCIVPFTRGREVSKPSADVVAEVRMLVDHGVREVTLLGQNVNSYGRDRAGERSFAELLGQINDVGGLERIRFTTSHPIDCGDDLLATFAQLPKLMPFFHLPIQSGSDAVLAAMRRAVVLGRKTSVADYLERVARLRTLRPDVALSTDILVGHPGETEADFLATLDLLRQVRYATLFAFAYSVRPGTRAAELRDDVPLGEKKRRLHEVLRVQDGITRAWMAAHQDTQVEVLFEGPSRLAEAGPNSALGQQKASSQPQMTGRTPHNVKVNVPFDDPQALAAWPGRKALVQIERVGPHSLVGALVSLLP